MTDVVTGEAVPLELRLAKLPSRALAIGIDAAAYALCAVGLYGIVVNILPAVDQALATALGLAATITLLVAVPATIETLTRGKSLGKLALGLRVVRDDGGPVRTRHALVRALSGVFADFIVTSGVGAIFCSLLNERGKRIGDILAGTVVIRERVPAQPGLPPVSPQLAQWATTLEMSRLPNDLALAARNYLTRSAQLAPHIRADLGARLAHQVAAVVSPPPPDGVPPSAYLAAVVNERGRREAQRLSGQSTSPEQRPATPPQPSAHQQAPGNRPLSGHQQPPDYRQSPSGNQQPASPDQSQQAAPGGQPSQTEPTHNTGGFAPPA